MKVLVVGATGLLGSKVGAALRPAHDVIEAGLNKAPEQVDITRSDSLRRLFQRVGAIDAVVCTAGMVRFMPWVKASDDDWEHGLRQKLMGQVNLVRIGAEFVRDGGSFTLTSGILAQHPIAGSSIVSTVNGAIESFARSAAVELGRASTLYRRVGSRRHCRRWARIRAKVCRPRTWFCVTRKASRAA